MAVAFGPTSCPSGLMPESKLSHNPEAQYGFVPKHSHHGGKNIAPRAEKPFIAVRSYFSGAQRNGVFASDDVLRCVAMCGDVVTCAGACSQAQAMTATQRLEELRHQQRGFKVFVH